MPPVKFVEVLSFSSEDFDYPAENLLKSETYLRWKCGESQLDRQYVLLKLEKLTKIRSIDIGNNGSAFIEVLVSREGLSDFQVLLVSSAFMTPLEVRNETDFHRVRMFASDKLVKTVAEQKWDRVKICCHQPFKKNFKYGISFITVNSPDEDVNTGTSQSSVCGFAVKEEVSDTITVGSFFKRHKDHKQLAAVPQSSTSPAAIREVGSAMKRSSESPPPNVEFYQLKKKKVKESEVKSETAVQTLSSPVVATANQMGKPAKDKDVLKQNVNESSKGSGVVPTKMHKISDEKEGSKKQSIKENASKPKFSKNNADRGQVSTKRRGKKFCAFYKLMSDVVFVMSGYQNPERSQSRDKMLAMGAKYKQDWSSTCTHLMYMLDKDGNGSESEEEIWADELKPKEEKEKPTLAAVKSEETHSNNEYDGETDASEDIDTDEEIARALEKGRPSLKTVPNNGDKLLEAHLKSTSTDDDIYDADTDLDDDDRPDTSHLPLPKLGSFFVNKTFFLYGSYSEKQRKLIKRYVTAYNGKLNHYMDVKVDYVITDDSWDENFDEALKENSSLQFVKSQWIWKCSDKQKLVPHQPYLVVPEN